MERIIGENNCNRKITVMDEETTFKSSDKCGKWFIITLPATEDCPFDEQVFFDIENQGVMGPDGREFYPDKLPPGPITYSEGCKLVAESIIQKYDSFYKERGIKVKSLEGFTADDSLGGYISDPQTLSVDYIEELYEKIM